MISSLRFLILGALTIGTMAAHARDWGFSKDTVRESIYSGGAIVSMDSVRLANTGPDTLRFDSVSLELIHPVSAPYFEVMFGLRGTNHYFANQQGRTYYLSAPPPSPINFVLGPSQSARAEDFQAESQIRSPAKQAVIVQGDTLIIRLVFVGKGTLGRDTLILVGRQQSNPGPSVITPTQSISPNEAHIPRFFDLRGRRVKSVPEGERRVPAPVVSPKE